MKNVLICVSGLHKDNGIVRVIMNYYDSLIKAGYNIDFLEMIEGYTDSEYANIINENGGKIFVVPKHNKISRYNTVKKFVEKLLLERNYNIIHINLVNLYAYICVKTAKKIKLKNIIFHVHNPKHFSKMSFINDMFNNYCASNASKLIACSNNAGKSMFKKRKFKVINNTIDIKKYVFSKEIRLKKRNELKIKDKFIIGVVARIEKQKNPFFIIDIFKHISKNNDNALLLWIGRGSLNKKIMKYVKINNLQDKILFLGFRKDVIDLYSCMDVFLLPSKFEGLGMVFVEAQAIGLPTFASTNVPKDVNVSDLVHFLSLKEKASTWGEEILKAKIEENEREEYNAKVCNSKFNKEGNNTLVELYDEILNGE